MANGNWTEDYWVIQQEDYYSKYKINFVKLQILMLFLSVLVWKFCFFSNCVHKTLAGFVYYDSKKGNSLASPKVGIILSTEE